VTDQTTVLDSVRHRTMLNASADGSVIGFAESDASDGPFGRYRVADGDILKRQGYDYGTSWFNYEIGVNRNGTQYSIPTYGGTFIYDANLIKYASLGYYAGGQPIGVAYHPKADIVYYPWANTTKVYAYDTNSLVNPIALYEFNNLFNHPGNHAFGEGRLKISRDGTLLFATVEGGVRYVSTLPDTTPIRPKMRSMCRLSGISAPHFRKKSILSRSTPQPLSSGTAREIQWQERSITTPTTSRQTSVPMTFSRLKQPTPPRFQQA
jgi:hypothetical protein